MEGSQVGNLMQTDTRSAFSRELDEFRALVDRFNTAPMFERMACGTAMMIKFADLLKSVEGELMEFEQWREQMRAQSVASVAEKPSR